MLGAGPLRGTVHWTSSICLSRSLPQSTASSGHLLHIATVMGQIVYPPIIEVLTPPLMPHNVNMFGDRAFKEVIKVNEVIWVISGPIG